MRSYSTVLCHVLGSHPEIAGYAEMHLGYRGGVDLLRLRGRVSRSLAGDLQGRFVLDKILHDEYRIAPSIMTRDDVYPIVLVREPTETIQSVLAMGERIPSVPWYSDVGAVVDYYAKRLRTLAHVADQASRYIFVHAEEFVENTARVFGTIEAFLGLEEPLREGYATFPHTGEVGWGDDSPAIRAGRIVRGQESVAGASLDEKTLAPATRAFEDCCSHLAIRKEVAVTDG